ncbi:MAG: hypothetical protein LBE84_04750 [Planctomycetota bacterium]|jgi:hypothetical protein|nr:hypothetical protein [Planctomycetota bacterium]
MSISYWTAQKFSVLAVAALIAAAGFIVLPDFMPEGAVNPAGMAAVFPPGAVYAANSDRIDLARLYGLPEDNWLAAGNPKSVRIAAYSHSGPAVSLDNGKEETVSFAKAISYLAARDGRPHPERRLEPLGGLLNRLLDMHLRLLRRIEEAVAGWNPGKLLSAVIPRIAVAFLYCGAIWAIWFFLSRADRFSVRKNGFGLIYLSLALWPAYAIAVSLPGIGLADVIRHYPDSLVFLNWPALAGWGAVLAWPALVILLSLLDIVRSLFDFRFVAAVTHAAVLALGLASIPVMAIGALFALFAGALYIFYRAGRWTFLPSGQRA